MHSQFRYKSWSSQVNDLDLRPDGYDKRQMPPRVKEGELLGISPAKVGHSTFWYSQLQNWSRQVATHCFPNRMRIFLSDVLRGGGSLVRLCRSKIGEAAASLGAQLRRKAHDKPHLERRDAPLILCSACSDVCYQICIMRILQKYSAPFF